MRTRTFGIFKLPIGNGRTCEEMEAIGVVEAEGQNDGATDAAEGEDGEQGSGSGDGSGSAVGIDNGNGGEGDGAGNVTHVRKVYKIGEKDTEECNKHSCAVTLFQSEFDSWHFQGLGMRMNNNSPWILKPGFLYNNHLTQRIRYLQIRTINHVVNRISGQAVNTLACSGKASKARMAVVLTNTKKGMMKKLGMKIAGRTVFWFTCKKIVLVSGNSKDKQECNLSFPSVYNFNIELSQTGIVVTSGTDNACPELKVTNNMGDTPTLAYIGMEPGIQLHNIKFEQNM